MTGPALVGIFWFAALFSPALSFPYHDMEHCFDGKMLPVNIEKSEPGLDCLDKEGNKYKENATLISCCGCLKLTCETHTEPVGTYPSMVSNWTLTRSDSCCEDCHGSVFPAGSVMSEEKEKDSCGTTKTTKCVYVDVDGDKGEAVVEVSFDFKECCTDDSGIKELNSTVLEQKTCSRRTCERFEGNLYASWVSTQEKPGCDCCLVGDELIQDGKECTGIPNSKCCDGICMVPHVTPA